MSRIELTPPLRALSALALMLALPLAANAYDAHSYVTDGLVFQLDGIDNAGTGSHDATATTWVDLSGNGNDVVQADGKALPWKNDKSIERVNQASLISAPNLKFDFDRAFTLDFCGEQPTAANAYIIQAKPAGYYNEGGFQTVNNRKMKVFHGAGNFTTATALYTGHSLVAWRDGTTLGFHDAASDTVELKTGTTLGYNGLMSGPFAIASKADGKDSFTTPFYALRLYNRVLSRQEYRWNEIIDDIRFRGVTPETTEFTVDPLPTDFPVTTTPAAGTTAQKADGISVEFSISGLSTAGDGSLVADVATGVRAKLYGWKVGRGGPGTASYSSVTGTGSSGAAEVGTLLTHLTWDIRRQYQVTVNAANGAVSVGGGAAAAEQTVWVDAGTVTLTATPDAGATFSHWEGVGDVADPFAATVTVPINKVQTIKAVCASSAHVPETVTWKNVNGDWHNAANWDTGRVPEAGDTVVIAPPKNDYTITISSPTPQYASVSISNGAAKNKTTLVMTGWQACLRADEIVIGDNAIVKPAAAFNFNEPSNRVWMAGGRLAVSENGLVDANGCGCKDYCWRATHIGTHPNHSGVYGGNFIGSSGYGYPPIPYGDAEWPTMAGSCSDAGTAGGAIRLDFTGAVTIDGTVRANGTNNGSRTGSGGGILIVCGTVSGSGEVLAKPYDPMTDGNTIGVGGGGGRIAVHYDKAAQADVSDCTVRFDASSGIANDPKVAEGKTYWTGAGVANFSEDYIIQQPPGTLWFPDNCFLTAASYRAAAWRFGGAWTTPEPIGALTFDQPLVLDHCNLYLPASCTAFDAQSDVTLTGSGLYARHSFGLVLDGTPTTIAGDLYATGAALDVKGASLTVGGDVNLAKPVSFLKPAFDNAYAGGEVIVRAGSTNGTDQAYGSTFAVAGNVNVSAGSSVYLPGEPNDGAIVYMSAKNVTVDAGGKIDSEYGGWARMTGPGKGGQYNPGASYGGRGGGSNPKAPYGSERQPLDLGSGGYSAGGGAVRLAVKRILTLNGEINADGGRQMGQQYGSAGSGGSVYVTAAQIAGSGRISAAGGVSDQSSYNFSAGGGGRVAVWVQGADGWTGTATADGGYKHETTSVETMGVKTGEDGTVFWSIGSILSISAEPKLFGGVSPALGDIPNLQGDTIEFALTDGEDVAGATYYSTAAGDERAQFAGALVITGGGETTNVVAETSFSRAINEDTSVVWMFNNFQRHLTVDAPANGAVRVNGAEPVLKDARWVGEAETVTLEAVPNGTLLFFCWEGDTNGLDAASATITVDGSRPRNLVAKFWDGEHEPVTLAWTGATSGDCDWNNPANWDKNQVPGHFDIVTVCPVEAMTINVSASTPRLNKLVLGSGATIKMMGWETCLSSDEIEIRDNATVMTVGGFKCTEPSNRVWMAGNKLTVCEKGKISARCGGCIDLAWAAGGNTKTHYLQGGVYGGGFVGATGNGNLPASYGSAEWPTDPGSGVNSAGGGAIRLDFEGDVLVDGAIETDGVLVGGTGGSGGSVLLCCRTVSGSGEVTARTVSYSTDWSGGYSLVTGGGGGGGRIAVHYDPAAQAEVTDCTVRFDASSGMCHDPLAKEGFGWWSSYGRSESSEDYIAKMPQGTLWFPDNQFLTAASYRTAGWKFGGLWSSPVPVGALVFADPIVFDDCDLEFPASCTSFTAQQGVTLKGNRLYGRRASGLYLTNAVATVAGDLNAVGARFEIVGGSLTVDGDVNLTQDGSSRTNSFSGGEVAIKASATNGTDLAYGAAFTVSGAINVSTNAALYLACDPADGAIPYVKADRMTVAAGGKVSAMCGGWGKLTGPAAGSNQYYPGGTHAGRGAPTNNVALTKIYGLRKRPVAPGSGGFFNGGGVVRIDLDRTLELFGSIDADANRLVGNQYGSGGAGGSIYLRVPHLSGSGLISAAGGLSDQSSYNFAAGGGGRVAIWTRDAAGWTGTVSVEGGYKHEAVNTYEPLAEKTAEDGTVHWHNLPGGTLILVR